MPWPSGTPIIEEKLMEFNARYTLTALFTLVVIAGIFGFIYWLSNVGGFGAKKVYLVRFTTPVSGMTTGSNVLFNGLKVGEVTELYFDKDEPGHLLALVSVAEDTPVRMDTKAGVDYQGLTGAPNILLTGGERESPPLDTGKAGIATINVAPEDTRSWTQNAGRVLAQIESLFDRNSGRFESILGGLERLAGADEGQRDGKIYDLKPPVKFPSIANQPTWQLAIAEPTIVLSLNTDKVLEQKTKDVWTSVGNARWSDNLPNLFQTKILQSFENAGYVDAVLRPADALNPDFRLIVDIRTFHLRSYDMPTASIDLVAKIIDRDGNVVSSQRFHSDFRANSLDESDIVDALGEVFSSSIKELVDWCSALL